MLTGLWLFVRLLFAFSASYFSLLAQRISNQKKCTPASACSLRYSACRAVIETRPSGLHKTQATAELEQPMTEGPVNPALLGASDGDPEHHATAIVREFNNKESVFLRVQISTLLLK
jgi:hypothetical protein